MGRRRGLGDVKLVETHVPDEIVEGMTTIVVLVTHMFVEGECRVVAGVTGGRRWCQG